MLNMGLFSDATLLAWMADLYKVFNEEGREEDVRMDAFSRLTDTVVEARLRGLEIPSFAVGLGVPL